MRWLDGFTDLMDMSFEQAPGVDEGQGSLACCSPWDYKELDTTEWLNNNKLLLITGYYKKENLLIFKMNRF